MRLFESVRGLVNEDTTILYECRICGTTLPDAVDECRHCGSGEIAHHEW